MLNIECPCYSVSEYKGHLVTRNKTRIGHHEKDVKLIASLRAKNESVPQRLLAAVQENAIITAGKGSGGYGRAKAIKTPKKTGGAAAPTREEILTPEANRIVAEMLEQATAALVGTKPSTKASSSASAVASSSKDSALQDVSNTDSSTFESAMASVERPKFSKDCVKRANMMKPKDGERYLQGILDGITGYKKPKPKKKTAAQREADFMLLLMSAWM